MQFMRVENVVSKNRILSIIALCSILFILPSIKAYADNDVISAVSEVASIEQNKMTVTGEVRDDEGELIPGANVWVKGSTNGTITDIDGKFSLKTASGETIVVSFVGYINAEKKVVASQKVYNFTLKPEAKLLDEVVVTGYQTISKERATGSFAIVNPKDMEGKLQTNILDRMEGMVAGLKQIPGKTPEIRGISTLKGEVKPLYVVDGIPYEGELNAINPSDIVNVTVLKDATAASIYGARSANGVIVITTRMGQTGKLRVNYNGTIKFKPLPDRDYLNLTSSAELVDLQQDLFAWKHNAYKPTDKKSTNEVYLLLYQHEAGEISDGELANQLIKYRNQDRYDQVKNEFLRKAEITHQHNLSFNGGSDIYKYALSVNYQGTMPYEKEQKTKRLGFNFKNQFDFFKWLRVDVGILNSNVNKDYNNGFSGYSYLNSGPSYRMLRNEDGTPTQWYNNKSQLEIDRLNSIGLQDETYKPLSEVDKAHYNYENNYMNLNLGINIKLMKGLNLDLRYQNEKTDIYDKQYYTKDSYTVKTQVNDATAIDKNTGEVTNYIPLGGRLAEKWEKIKSYTLRAQLNFNREFASLHDVQVLIGAERRKVTDQYSTLTKYGYDDTSLSYKYINELDLQTGIKGTESTSGSFYFNGAPDKFIYKDNRYVSFYGNASYTFNRKATITGSIRMDQSNLFGTDPKYQYKPLWSVGGHYVALENWGNWLDRLAIRLTYGINGNVAKDSGPYMITKDDGTNSYTNDYQSYISTPPNPALRWEKTKVFNIGIDFNTLHNRLNGSIEFYNKYTSDLMGERATDPTLGWNKLTLNYGEMRNSGIEISLQSENIVTHDFRWTSNLIFSYNKNKLTKIENSGTGAIDYFYALQNREGYAMNSLYSIRYAGLNEQGYPTAYKADGTKTNDYTELTKEDLVYSGTTTPPYSASLSNRFSYKGFDLEFMFVFYGGHKLRDVAASYLFNRYPILNYAGVMDRDRLHYWKNPGDENDPDMAPNYIYGSKASNSEYIWSAADKHVQKGDYIKLRDLALGYTFPKEWVRKCYVQNLRVNMQIQNLWYWAANKRNLDPEAWSGISLSPSRGTHYPATFTLGISADF